VNPIGLRSCYDEGKRCAETLFFDYHRQHKLRIKVPRIFNTYGPRMHPNDGRVVSNFIIQALKGEPITIYGDGSQTRSFCYVDDLVEGLIRLMATDDKVTGPMNLGNPREFTILQLAEEVIRQTKSKSKIVRKKLPSDDPKQRRPDISLAKSELRWKPSTQLEEGLGRRSTTSREASRASARVSLRSAICLCAALAWSAPVVAALDVSLGDSGSHPSSMAGRISSPPRGTACASLRAHTQARGTGRRGARPIDLPQISPRSGRQAHLVSLPWGVIECTYESRRRSASNRAAASPTAPTRRWKRSS
jgi:hypothetical protein